MLFQTIKLSGIAALLTLGVVGTVVLAQQGKNHGDQVRGGSRRLPQEQTLAGRRASGAAQPPRARAARPSRSCRCSTNRSRCPSQRRLRSTDVLKYIKQATTTPTFTGIPIYVDPVRPAGGRTIAQLDHPLDCAGHAPEDEPAHLILKQLGLAYIVKDGFLMIDSRASITEMQVEEIDRKLDQVLESLKRLERRWKMRLPLPGVRGSGWIRSPPCIPWRSG